MIRIDRLDKYFNKGKGNQLHVINDLSLELPEQGMVAVFGRSGCGKTTLLNTLGGLDGFSGGDILYGEESIRRDTDRLRNEKIGYIFQNYNLQKQESVFDNVADALRLMGLRDEAVIAERVSAALANVGMLKYRSRTPETLSGGQQQRVAIARAIVKNPPVILADEPTGNLDEANTLLVMDLLRQIAKDHLVVLVTHEEKLVEEYCDRVIKLSDGRIEAQWENDDVRGHRGRRGSRIYLGELPGSLDKGRFTDIRCYGEAEGAKIQLTLVREGGKTYLRVDSPGVELITESSEVKLIAGPYVEENERQAQEDRIDMSRLAPITEHGKTGRLFTFRQSLRSGYAENFVKKRKKKNKLLRRAMVMFAAIFVMMSAYFGVGIRSLKDVDKTYESRLLYLYLGRKDTTDKLAEALEDEDSGIDGYTLRQLYTFSLNAHRFSPGYFETFTSGLFDMLDDNFKVNAAALPVSLLKDARVLAGSLEQPEENAVVLSSAVADELLKNSNLGYVKTYENLLGLVENRYGDGACIVTAVVDSPEYALFYNDRLLAEESIDSQYLGVIRCGTVPGYETAVGDGEALLIVQNAQGELPREGETVLIQGVPLKVKGRIDIQMEDPTYDAFYIDDDSYGFSWRHCICDNDSFYLVSDGSFDRVAQSFGETHSSAMAYYGMDYSFDEDGNLIAQYVEPFFAAVHAEDVEKAERYLEEHFPELEQLLPEEGRFGRASVYAFGALVTPEELRENELKDLRAGIRGKLVSMLVMLAILSLCMYFIMRAALLSRIREVGIYRAIGVTKGNLKFRFLTEAGVLTALTVLPGYLFSSVIVGFWLSTSTLMKNLFYYPLWLALAVLVLLMLLCLGFGVLPVSLLLKKTPSEILAKYDI